MYFSGAFIFANCDRKMKNFAVLQFRHCAKAACKPCVARVCPVNQTAKKIFENTAGTVGLARFPSCETLRENFTRSGVGWGLVVVSLVLYLN